MNATAEHLNGHATEPAIAPAAEGEVLPFFEVPIDRLAESKLNPRRHFNEQKLAELAESIKKQGVIEPIVVRELARGHFEIIAGARQYRAAKLAGLKSLPARRVQLTDEQALEVMVVENSQREDVHPLEESEGFGRLLKVKDYTVELLAERVGKTASYVYKRLALSNLVEPLKQAFFDREIQLVHAFQLCRLREEDQNRALKQGLYQEQTQWNEKKRRREVTGKTVVTPRELEDWLHDNVYLSLSKTPWDKADAELDKKAGACNTCTKRSGANLELFDDSRTGDRCLDRDCFHRKQNAFVRVTELKFKEAGEALARIAGEGTPYGEDRKKKLEPIYNLRQIKQQSDVCESAEKGIIVAGRDVGRLVTFCRAKTCKKHYSQHGYQKSAPAKVSFAEQWARKKRNLEQRIDVESRRELVRTVMDKVGACSPRELHLIGERFIERVGHDTRKELCEIFGVEGSKRTGPYIGGGLDFTKPLLARLKEEQRTDKICAFLIAVAIASPFNDTEAKEVAKIYDVDAAAVRKVIAAPLLEKFEAAKKKAQAKQAEAKKTGKKGSA